jgi:phosphonopyruvate decarboxylase
MLSPKVFVNALRQNNVDMFVGVPDSLLSSLCAYLDDNERDYQHIITANEGNAIGLTVGYHLSTGKIGAVYLQNSGLGNVINPLTSLADPEVYKIPLLLIIGWRGEPGVKDEPQHVKQGRITESQLDLLEIPYWILSKDTEIEPILSEVFLKLRTLNAPVALLVRKDVFVEYKGKREKTQLSPFKREEALRHLLEIMEADDIVISTTGKTSREVFELRLERGESQRDFLTVGGMGHTASIALGVALGNPKKRVICLDGDGSVLMHMGALPIIGDQKPGNLIHVLLNNAAHESVGGQPTVAGRVDFAAIAKACGYSGYQVASNAESLRTCWDKISHQNGPVLFEIRVSASSREDLGRPSSTPQENKNAFMRVARD